MFIGISYQMQATNRCRRQLRDGSGASGEVDVPKGRGKWLKWSKMPNANTQAARTGKHRYDDSEVKQVLISRKELDDRNA